MIQSGYTKLFGSIIASTIWREDDKTRIVWITLLALSDRQGFVAGSIPGLADLARVSIAECEQALEKLQRPDHYSRSPEHDGRRIEVISGGWFILNRAKYRDQNWKEDRRERDRIRQQRHRKRQREAVTRDSVTECDISVTGVMGHNSSDKTETEKEKSKPASRTKHSKADPRFKPFVDVISRYWLDKNTIPLVWDQSEGKALKLLLAASPHLTAEQFAECLANRADSEGIAHGDRPRVWLGNVQRYANGPLDRFGKTMEVARCR